MGYKRKKTVYRMRFEGELEGLEVTATAPPLGFLEDAMSLASLTGKNAKDLTPEEYAKVMGLFSGFANHLVSWNLENDDDTPVPATLEGCRSQDLDFMFEIIEAWLDAVGNVGESDPLGRPSSDGRPSLEASMPMEPLSSSLPSSSGPSSSSAAASGSGASLVS